MTGTKRAGWRVVALGLACGVVCTAMLAAKTKLPVPSTWELDQLRSDFGGGPKMQSEVFTVNEDKPNLLSMDFVIVDEAGHTSKSSWSGPQNGKMLPLTGSDGASFGIDRDGNEHWMYGNGATRVGKMSLEKDKRTVLLRVVYTAKDGTQYNQVLMFNRTDQ